MPATSRRRVMSLALLLLLLGGAYVYLQSSVPMWVAAYIERQVEKTYSGRTTVRLEAYPFWKLFAGRFDRLELTGLHWHGEGQEFQRVHLVWYDGSISMGELTVGVLQVRHEGALEASVTVSQSFLATRLPVSLLPYHPRVTIRPQEVVLTAEAEYAGLSIPLTLAGTLVPVASGTAVAFVPSRLKADGYPLPLPPPQIVFRVRSLPLPKGLTLRVIAVRLGQDALTLSLAD